MRNALEKYCLKDLGFGTVQCKVLSIRQPAFAVRAMLTENSVSSCSNPSMKTWRGLELRLQLTELIRTNLLVVLLQFNAIAKPNRWPSFGRFDRFIILFRSIHTGCSLTRFSIRA